MRLKNLDLIGAILFAVANLGWALFPNRSPIVGIIFVIPLVFFLPGYTLTEMLFYKKSSVPKDQLIRKPTLRIEQPFKGSDRFVLSIGLSLAIAILAGFILNVLPIGLQALSWAVFLGLVTAIFSLVTAYLRRGIRVNPNRFTPLKFHITIYECVLLVLAVAVASLSIFYSTVSAKQQQHPGFTQLWILPSNQVNNSCDVLVGVQNFETTSVTYHIVITMNGTRVTSLLPFVLAPQKEWDQSISIKSMATDNMSLEANLYRIDEPEVVYRNVHLTLHGIRANNSGKVQKCTMATS